MREPRNTDIGQPYQVDVIGEYRNRPYVQITLRAAVGCEARIVLDDFQSWELIRQLNAARLTARTPLFPALVPS